MQRTTLQVVKHEVTSRDGMVVAQHPLIAEAGAEMLRDGGNAMDAAVTAAFSAGVAEPFMSGIGGGGVLIADIPTIGPKVVEFAMRVPALADERSFTLDPDAGGEGLFSWPAVIDSENRIGWKAPLVPGAVAGLCLALERYGTRPLAETLAPAIRLAREGFRADWYLTLNIACAEPELRADPDVAATYLPGGHPPRARLGFGETIDVFKQPALADTLELIAREGARAFYEGSIAEAIDRASRERGGLLRASDLARYRPIVHELPLHATYAGCDVFAVPGPMAGATFVEMLQILDGLGLPMLGHNSPAALHLLAEAMRRAYADRFAYLADPDFAAVPLKGITDPRFAAQRRGTIDPRRADPLAAPGDPWAFEGGASALPSAVGIPDASCTTHLCVVDRDRMMVSLTNTLVELFGSRRVVPGTGVLLNNGMVWFDPRPGTLNSVSPRRRALANMTPVVVRKNDRPYLAMGAPGGRRLMTGVLQALVNVVDYGMGVQDAVGAPRIHSEDAVTYVDSRLPRETIAALESEFGQRVVVQEETFAESNFGRVVAIQSDEATGLLSGGAHLWQPATAIGL